jgi:hypothetical protein
MPLLLRFIQNQNGVGMWWNKGILCKRLSENQIDLGLDLFFPQRESYGVIVFWSLGLPCFQTRNPDKKRS